MKRVFRLAALLVAALGLGAARPSSVDAERLAALVTDGAPRGLVTVVIPVPAEFAGNEDVSFEVRSTGEMEVLGRRSGLARVAGAATRPLVLTVRVPAGADAGNVPAADVHFRSATQEFVVPVVVRVTLVRKVSVLGPREMRGLRLGDRLTLSYRVANAGNATDTLVFDARGPLGWSVRLARPARLVIPPRADVEVGVTVVVPSTANIGDHVLAVTVRPEHTVEVVGTVYTTLGITGRAGQSAGVVLKPGIAMASTSAGSAIATGIVLEGPMRPDVYVHAQFSPATAQGGLVTQGLSSVGAFASPFSAVVNGRDWDVAAGNVGLQLADLTGVNVMGQGVTARVERADAELRMIAATPNGGRGSGGSLLGAGYWRQTGYGHVGGSLSRFIERRGFSSDRELTAAGVDFASNEYGTIRLSASLAHRSAGFTSGLGMGATLTHEREGERVTLRATHAPGGTGAFARATDELQFDVARVITDRWSMDFSALRSGDQGPVFSAMDVASYSLGQRYALTDEMQLTLRGMSSSFLARSAGSSVGDFGARDRSLVGGGEWRRGLLAVSAEASLGVVSRDTERTGGRMFTSAALQRGVHLGMSRAFERFGAFDASLSMDFTGEGVGIPSRMLNGTARWSALPVNVLSRQARLSAEASYQRLGGLPAVLVLRSGATMALPGGLDLAMSVERNPFFRDARGRAGWVGALRLTASTRVFTADALGPAGIVFEDRNLNGVRDKGEPGVRGVVVRRGESRGRTKEDGSYRLPVHARGVARIDQSSLPLGLIAHPRLATGSIESLDLPVLPTASVSVTLEIVADSSGRVPQVDLEPAIVMLRDATGFEWVGRRLKDGRHEFRGIPVGKYTVLFNGSRLREQLLSEAESIELTPGEVREVRVELRSRVIRVFTPSSRSRQAGGPRESPEADSATVSTDSTSTKIGGASASADKPPERAPRATSIRTYYAPGARRNP